MRDEYDTAALCFVLYPTVIQDVRRDDTKVFRTRVSDLGL